MIKKTVLCFAVALVLCIVAPMKGAQAWYNTVAQQEQCYQKQVCTQYDNQCTGYSNVCLQWGEQCKQYEQVCTSWETKCLAYEDVYKTTQVCAQYAQTCAQWNYKEDCQQVKQEQKQYYTAVETPVAKQDYKKKENYVKKQEDQQKKDQYIWGQNGWRWYNQEQQQKQQVQVKKVIETPIATQTCKKVQAGCARWQQDTSKCEQWTTNKQKIGVRCANSAQVCSNYTQGKCAQSEQVCLSYGQKCTGYQQVCKSYGWQWVCQQVQATEQYQQKQVYGQKEVYGQQQKQKYQKDQKQYQDQQNYWQKQYMW
jgi:hypothetical protein